MPYPGIGGTEQATLRMARITQESGFENHFFVPDGFDEVHGFFGGHGFPVHTVHNIEPSLSHFPRYYRDSIKAGNIFRDLRIDLLHAADFAAGFDNALAARLSRIPIVCHVRNPQSEISRRDKVFLSLVDHWLFVSASTKGEFAARASDARSEVLYDGIEISDVTKEAKLAARRSILAEFGLGEETFIIGSLARIAHQKDHLTLAKAILELSDDLPNLVVLAIGPISQAGPDAENYEVLKTFIQEHGLQEKFILGGYRTDTPTLMAAFDIHVLSTHFEGFGLVIHEAMAKRTPVITTAVGGTVEAMTDGIGGYLVEHGNASQLAAKIKTLLTDHRLAAKMGNDGYEFVKANFSSERFRQRILDFYKKVLEKRP